MLGKKRILVVFAAVVILLLLGAGIYHGASYRPDQNVDTLPIHPKVPVQPKATEDTKNPTDMGAKKKPVEPLSYVPESSINLPVEAQGVLPYDLVLGSKEAPITVIEYSSLACPHCGVFHKNIYPEIKKNFIDTGVVLYIYRDFPTSPSAMAASTLAYCGGEKRAALLQSFFETQAMWAFTANFRTVLKDISQLGAIKDADKCMDDQELKEGLMRKAYNAGKEYGVVATPMFFINGQPFANAASYEAFADKIKEVQGGK